VDSSHEAPWTGLIGVVSDTWSLPGYDVVDLIGAGATGEVWRGRDLDTGDTVALKRLRPGADPARLTALRREATLLRTLDTPYVVRLRDVIDDVLVLDHAPGGSLSALLARRGPLDPGEVVTIAAPLASGLASAHAVGLVHGDVSASNVLFTADGMPLLTDLGVARLADDPGGEVHGTADYVAPDVAAGGIPGAASDVWALAALCHQMLAGTAPHDGETAPAVLFAAVQGARAPLGLLAPTAPRALVAAVEAGLARDPRKRPDAAAFASLLRRAHAASPVRLGAGPLAPPPVRETHVVRPAPAGPQGPRHGRRRRALAWVPPPRALAVGALGLLVALAGLVGWWSGRAGTPAAAAVPALSTGPASDAAPDWPGILTELDAARTAAYRAGDPGALGAVWAPGSPGLRADTASLQALADRGQVVHGLRHTLRSVTAVPGEPTRLLVVDVLSAHEVRDRAGTVVRMVPARSSASWELSMRDTDSGWRIESVTAR
jgi:hypothetical protein